MRIIAGKYRGRQLTSSKDQSIRPTTNRIKEYIFQLLGESVPGASVLDLFSGAGGLGLEALSRGASSVEFVDLAAASLKVLRRNIDRLKIEEPCRLVRKDALRFLRTNEHPYDLVFADPPFAWGDFDTFLELAFLERNLAREGILIVESEKSHHITWERPGRHIRSQKTFDRSVITILTRQVNS